MVLIDEKSISKLDPSRRKAPKIPEANLKTYESYLAESTDKERDMNYWDTMPYREGGPESEMKRFLSQCHVDKDQGIRKTVSRIIRTKAIDWNHPKHARKDWLYYELNVYGQNLEGITIAPVCGHVVGLYYETVRRPELEDGKVVHKMVEQRPAYYIPFSPAKLDEIIKSSDDENIKFVAKFQSQNPGEGNSGRTEITLDMMRNWTFDELIQWWNRDPKFKADYTKKSIQSQSLTMNNSVT